MITVRALGPVEILDENDAAMPPLHRKNLALLIYLARSPGHARTRDQIVGLLWADKPDQAARHSLRQAIRDLKTALGDDVLVTATNQLGLAPDAFAFDFDHLEELRDVSEWAAAADLVRGGFMDGFGVQGASAFEDWLSAERALWQRRSVEVLIATAEQSLTAGDVMTAADRASVALSIDPHSDAAAQLSMRCAAIAGNPVGAREQFEAFCERLSAIGVEPHETTRRLSESIERERQWNLPRSVTQGEEPSHRMPLIGRSSELGAAVGCWNETRLQGQGHVILLEGEQGTGKTRLAEEITARARLDGAYVSWIRAVQAEEETSWSGVVGLFAGGLLDTPGLAGAAPEDLAAIAGIIPELEGRFAKRDRAALPPLELALSRTLKVLCDEQPVVLVFDDAHFLDAQSLDLLHTMTRDLSGFPLLVLLTSSPQHPRPQIDDLRARVGRELKGHSARLQIFSSEEIMSLVQSALPDYTQPQLDRVARRIALDSGGIPLLAVELLHGVSTGLDVEPSESHWPATGRTLDQTPPGDLPDAVIGAIRAAYWRAPEAARRVLLVVAALGERVPPEHVRRAIDLDAAALDEALDWLEWEHWLESERRGYSYAARIVREVVNRDMLTPGQAQRFRETAASQ